MNCCRLNFQGWIVYSLFIIVKQSLPGLSVMSGLSIIKSPKRPLILKHPNSNPEEKERKNDRKRETHKQRQ